MCVRSVFYELLGPQPSHRGRFVNLLGTTTESQGDRFVNLLGSATEPPSPGSSEAIHWDQPIYTYFPKSSPRAIALPTTYAYFRKSGLRAIAFKSTYTYFQKSSLAATAYWI